MWELLRLARVETTTQMTPSRILALVAGMLLVAYGLWSLRSGKVLITWGQFAERPSPFYWVVVAALLLLGVVNLWWGVASLPRNRR